MTLELEANISGSLELTWDLQSDSLHFINWNLEIGIQVKLVGSYVRLLAYCINPAIVTTFDEIDEVFKMISTFSLYEIAKGEFILLLKYTTGLHTNGKIEVIPEVKALIIDINENNNPEFELSAKGKFSIDLNPSELKFSGELNANVKWDLLPQFKKDSLLSDLTSKISPEIIKGNINLRIIPWSESDEDGVLDSEVEKITEDDIQKEFLEVMKDQRAMDK